MLLLLTLLSLSLILGVVACGNNKKVNTFNQMQKRAKLLIGTEASYRPFEYHDENDEIIEFDIDIAKAIATEMA